MKLKLAFSLVLLLAFAALFVLDGCGTECTNKNGLGALGCSGSGGDTGTDTGGDDGGGSGGGSGLLYVANTQSNAILRFDNATTLEGDVAPTATIQGALTRLSAPAYLFLDVSNDRLYVANAGQSSILVFDNVSTLDGNIAPTRFIEGANTTLSAPSRAILDFGRDILYVDNAGQQSILAFANGATIEADIAPTRRIAGANPGLGNSLDMFLDASADRLYVANTGGGSVLVFDLISTLEGNLFPQRILRGGNTRLGTPQSILVDSGNNLLVADANSLLRFANADTVEGDVAPTAVISGANTGLLQPGQMLLNGGDLYLANTGSNEILIFEDFSSQETGNPFPNRRIGGTNTRILGPSGIALDLSR